MGQKALLQFFDGSNNKLNTGETGTNEEDSNSVASRRKAVFGISPKELIENSLELKTTSRKSKDELLK